jgi:hypothetical protein
VIVATPQAAPFFCFVKRLNAPGRHLDLFNSRAVKHAVDRANVVDNPTTVGRPHVAIRQHVAIDALPIYQIEIRTKRPLDVTSLLGVEGWGEDEPKDHRRAPQETPPRAQLGAATSR